jgi:hypothetical protein
MTSLEHTMRVEPKRGPQRRSEDARCPPRPSALPLIEPDRQSAAWLRDITASGEPQPPAQQLDGVLSAGCRSPIRTLTGCLVPAPVAVVRATKCGVGGLSFIEPVVA